MTNEELLAVITASMEGKDIERKRRNDAIGDSFGWQPVGTGTGAYWNCDEFVYRIKPEPRKPREWWFVKDIGSDKRFAWTRYDLRQEGVDYLEQVHVRELLPEEA